MAKKKTDPENGSTNGAATGASDGPTVKPSDLYAVELPGERDHALLAAAVELYAKHLDGLEEVASKMGRSRDAARYEHEADALRDELGTPLANGVSNVIYGRHLPIITRGLNYLITNLRAAKGTLRGLGAWTEPWVTTLTESASYVEAGLVPKFDEQRSLPLTGEPNWKCPKCEFAADKAPKKCPECGYEVDLALAPAAAE